MASICLGLNVLTLKVLWYLMGSIWPEWIMWCNLWKCIQIMNNKKCKKTVFICFILDLDLYLLKAHICADQVQLLYIYWTAFVAQHSPLPPVSHGNLCIAARRCCKASQIWVTIWSGNGVLSDSTKPLLYPTVDFYCCKAKCVYSVTFL